MPATIHVKYLTRYVRQNVSYSPNKFLATRNNIHTWTCSGVGRSQTMPGHCTYLSVGGAGWGNTPLVNFCILEVSTQIVLETAFEMSSVLNQEKFWLIRARSTGLHYWMPNVWEVRLREHRNLQLQIALLHESMMFNCSSDTDARAQARVGPGLAKPLWTW